MNARKLFFLSAVLLLSCLLLKQCREEKSPGEYTKIVFFEDESLRNLAARMQDFFDDPSLGFRELMQALAPCFDSLRVLVRDEDNPGLRISAQLLSYRAIALLEDRCEMEETDEADVNEKDNMASRLVAAIRQWYYSEVDGLPVIWQDMCYVSKKETDDPIDGFFHFMVILPSEDRPEAKLKVFFPDNAVSHPQMIFFNYDDDGVIEGDHFDNWYMKTETGDGHPLYGVAGQDIVDKMLAHDVMALSFSNSEREEDVEIAQLRLNHFQQKYKELRPE